VPRLTPDELAHFIDDHEFSVSRRSRSRAHQRQANDADVERVRLRPRVRAHEARPFKCGHCQAFIGPTLSGGRHRNHCPLCLASRHVDRRKPGERESPCRAMMPAIGVAYRTNGEQMVIHRCNGCGIERRNRVAADDNSLALLRLPPLAAVQSEEEIEEVAIA
jgi:hypothetical protein